MPPRVERGDRLDKPTRGFPHCGVKHLILAAGKPALGYARDGIAEYLKRLTRYGTFELRHVKDGTSADVSARLLDASQGAYRIALDERGESLTTAAWVERFDHMERRGDLKSVAFLIGASDGHTPELRAQADEIWCLSALTLQHELALLILTEQLYRVRTIKRGEPYHR